MMRDTGERGVALVAALLVLMLMSAMLTGFLVMVNADQAAGGIDRDQTQAYAAAHAGVEKLTADLGQLFNGNFSPTGAQLANLTTDAKKPVLPGISYVRPNGTSGYRITFTDVNPVDGNPDVADPNGTPIGAGSYAGLIGLITPYQVDVTARTTGNAEVKMRRTMQTIAIPVFQFGIFSENNLSFFAGPNFQFGGRVHTNQNLFLKQDSGNTLTLKDHNTAVGEVIRSYLANGVSGSHPGTIRVAKDSGCNPPPSNLDPSCFNLLDTQSSVVDKGSLALTLAAAENDKANDTALALNSQWLTVSAGTSGGWLKNWRTGAKRLDLPIVSDGAVPVDIIRRPPLGEVTNGSIGQQRFYNMATLRILISDRPEDLIGNGAGIAPLPGVVWTAAPAASATPVRLSGTFTPMDAINGHLTAVAHPFAASTGDTTLGFRTTAGTSSIDGWILINRQDRNGNWTDVTLDVLSLGFAGKRLSAAGPTLDSPNLNNDCLEAHPNSVIRVQRWGDLVGGVCNAAAGAAALADSANFWPNVLYDPREGMLRDNENARPKAPNPLNPAVNNVAADDQRLYFGGVMHYVELDVNNLRRWLTGAIGSTATNAAGCANGLGPATCPMDVTGFVVYFSDRRGNRNFGANLAADPAASDANGPVYVDDRETGEFGFEDNINTAATSAPNSVLDHQFTETQTQVVNGEQQTVIVQRWSEDINQSGTLETYGGLPRLPAGAMLQVAGNYTPAGTPFIAPANNQPNPAAYNLFTTPVDRNVARVNRAFFFRHALKLVNGGRGNLPANGAQGLTVASENAVYVQGNYNACTNAVPNQGNNFTPACTGNANGFIGVHVSAAVIADAVTLLSNSWNDIRSFRNPHDADAGGNVLNQDQRQAATTWYRLGIIAGKGLNFPRANVNPTARDHQDFGTDGGAHNFLRYIENWGGQTLNYRGSIVSLYTNRQAVGIYKCCNIVYNPPGRGYNFDDDFLNPNLLPPRTPMFRDINTLSFRQILRPTQ